ncbi:MAG: hypothetical protein BWY08_01866 [Bacteroidetes bacterium ADurb.Bin174]|jgi:hypothetical protein|nr:MAG: hypothetical protein BWY08_01866 [Bacteroidetes bacterium ADurb.Bin174]
MKNKLIAAKLEKNKFIKKFQYQFKFFLILAVSYKRPLLRYFRYSGSVFCI